MPYLSKLYSELKASKPTIYKNYECCLNVSKFINYLEKKTYEKILDNLYIIYFYNHGNGYSLYGKMSFDFHINLLFFDPASSNWYVVDYDIEKILTGFKLDQPLLYSKFLQLAFSTNPAKEQIKIAIEEDNYFPLQSFQQIMVFTLQEYKKLCLENPNLIHELRFFSLAPKTPEKNFLWKLYMDSNISFNNLYELTLFLEKRNASINLLRANYQNKTFREIFREGFSNTKCRLDKQKLLFLKNFLFDSSTSSLEIKQEEAINDKKLSNAQSTFFKSPPKEGTQKITEKNLDLNSGVFTT